MSQDPAYNGLKEHLIASTGLAFYTDRDAPLTELIGERLVHLGLSNCAAYAELLTNSRMGAAEMEFLITQLTIGETYFFRDPEQFTAIRDVILPEILDRKQSSKRLRIWSAGCATGAEPYSLAIVLAEDLGDLTAGWQIEIHATDLNRGFLALAAEGKFRERAVRSTSDAIRHKCFSKEGGLWTIHPRYKQWISFHHLNLAKSNFSVPWLAGTTFDLILCRNVMIYFTPAVNQLLVERFHESLEVQGWLVVGAAEHSLERYQGFLGISTKGAKIYQKLSTYKRKELMPAPLPATVAEVLPMPLQLPLPPAVAMAPGAAWRLPQPPGVSARVDLEGLRQLADRGDWQGADAYGQKLLTQDLLNPTVHFYRALIFENLGSAHESERSLRQAIYLDRTFAIAHYHLGLMLKRGLQKAAAARSFGNVLRVLEGLPEQAIVTNGAGVTVTGLKQLAKMYLENRSGT